MSVSDAGSGTSEEAAASDEYVKSSNASASPGPLMNIDVSGTSDVRPKKTIGSPCTFTVWGGFVLVVTYE